MTFNISRAEPILKEMYPTDVVKNLTYKNRPFYAMLPKDENFVGELRKVSMQYGNVQNRSTNFAIAKSQNQYNRYEDFKTTRVANYSMATVTNETILATQNDDGAFIDALEREMKGAFNSLANSLAYSVIADGSYKIGRRDSDAASVTTLTDARDIVNFEVGMELEASDTTTGSTVRSGFITVTAVDREAGTFTYSGSISGYADNDYLYPRGDKGAAISGAAAWVPYEDRSTKLAASFFGVTRNVDSTRLGGWYLDRSTYSIEEALLESIVVLDREGATPDCIFLNPLKWKDLVNSLGSKVQYIKTTIADVAFEGVLIHGPQGPVKVYSDRWIPYAYSLTAQMDTWKLASLGPAIRVFDTDGLRVLRSQTVDGVDIQLNSYAQLENHAPGYNMWTKLS